MHDIPKHYPACNMWLSHTTGKYRGNLFLQKDKLLKNTFSFSGSMSSDAILGMWLYACTLYFYHFIQVYDMENRSFAIRFLLLQNFSVAIYVSPHVCFILVLILISMFLR